MTYIAGSILERKVPQEDEYDKVRVVSRSPVVETVRNAEWADQGANDYWVISPTDFGANIVKHTKELERDYDLISEPSEPPRAKPEPLKTARKSPEQLLREAEDA